MFFCYFRSHEKVLSDNNFINIRIPNVFSIFFFSGFDGILNFGESSGYTGIRGVDLEVQLNLF